MPDPTTSNRGYAIPTRGSNVGQWDLPINGNASPIDQNLGAVSTIALSNTDVTLLPAQYACGTIRLTGVLTANPTVTFPTVSGWWLVDNQTTGNFAVQLACNPTANRIGVPQGVASDVFTDGSNIGFRNLPGPGSYWDYAGSTVPAWVSLCTVTPWLNCDGSTFSSGTYPILASILGTTTLPDLRGTARYTLNQGTGRLTTAGSGLDGNTRFALKTTQANTLLTANLPPYTPSGSLSISSSGVANATTTPINTSLNNFAVLSPGVGNPYTLPLTISSSGTFSGAAQGGTSTPFGVVGPGTISGITLIRAA